MTTTITPPTDALQEAEWLETRRQSESLIDPLTGSWNCRYLRIALRARLEVAKHLGHTVVVAYADLDNFRAFNDLWGHQTGDAALCAVTARLQRIRHNGIPVDVARLGRDEYVLITETRSGNADTLEDLGRSISDAVRAPLMLGAEAHQISISVGLTESTALSTTDSILLEARLSLLNERGGSAGATRIFDRTHGANAEVVQALPAALRNNEIRCAFQPTIDVRTGNITHLEALARWTRPSGEVVGPAVFVPCAESFGLASELTRAVLASVAQLLAKPTTPSDLRVWVNLSARELDLDGFPGLFLDMLSDEGIAPHRIGVEITESEAVRDPLRLAGDIAQLQENDVVVAIDDFGSGYSPLGYLRTLNPDVVKLDRSLISDIETDAVNQQVVIGVLGVLNELGIGVIAEGVERVEEQQWLCDHGIHNAQGFLWQRPTESASLDLGANHDAQLFCSAA